MEEKKNAEKKQIEDEATNFSSKEILKDSGSEFGASKDVFMAFNSTGIPSSDHNIGVGNVDSVFGDD